ncbi:MAG TPA: transglycosylase SLT domain-containing protein [Nevskiales bacterium]|nr:transglycosylase SLT domain-containing protein [Nevskiales bacterium]
MNPAAASRPAASMGPDFYRRFAELLVDGGLLTRREVELALREARRAREPLGQWLVRHGRLKPQHLALARRLELLLVRHRGGLSLAELLRASGELSPGELKRALELRARTGQPLAEILLAGEGARRRRAPRGHNLSPLAAAASAAAVAVCAWMLAPAPATAIVTPTHVALPKPLASVPAGADLRFASLGDITPHLQRLRQRPGPYRRPPQVAEHARLRATQLRPLVAQYARQYRLPPELILAVIEQESSFNPQAQSARNAIGLMQLVPDEAGREAYRYAERRAGTPTLQELQDPQTNIRLGSAYLRLLLDRHFDDIESEDARVAVALAAYNWGPTRMRKALERHGLPDSVDEVEALLEKHAPAETRDYVRKITGRMEAFG